MPHPESNLGSLNPQEEMRPSRSRGGAGHSWGQEGQMSAWSPLPCWKPKGLPLPQSPVSPQTAPVGPDLAPLFWSVPRRGSGAPCSTHHSPPFRSGPILLLSGLICPPWIHATQAERTAPLPTGLSLKGSLLPGSHWSQASSRTPNPATALLALHLRLWTRHTRKNLL